MKIDLIGGSYQQRYLEFNSQRTINWYPVITAQEENSRSKTALFPFPGLTTYVTLPGRYSRGIYNSRTPQFPNRCFAVVDNTLYEITNNAYTTLGTLSNLTIGSSKVYMIDNAGGQLGIFHPSASYVLNLVTNTITQITTNQFPGNVTYADFLDGYGVVVSNGSTFFSLANDFLSGTNIAGWQATNFFTPGFKPDGVVAAIALREEIYNFCSTRVEIYINDGTTPYSRLPRSTVYVGLLARESLVTTSDGFYFLGRNNIGETGVYFFDSYYSSKGIAPTSIVWNFGKTDQPVDDAYAYIVNAKDGQQFYYLTIPSLNNTFILNTKTSLWNERQSTQPFNDSNGDIPQKQFRGRHYTNFNGLNLWQDLYSGKIFKEDYTNVTEDNNVFIRTRISETFNQEYQNITIHSLELDMNTGYGLITGQGSNPVLMLSYSKDSGYNYGNMRNMNLGLIGQHSFRARLMKLGTARNWTFKLSVSDPIDVEINNAIAKGVVSNN